MFLNWKYPVEMKLIYDHISSSEEKKNPHTLDEIWKKICENVLLESKIE